MSFELMFLAILVIGIVLVGVGVLRHLKRGLSGTGAGINYTADAAKSVFGAYKNYSERFRPPSGLERYREELEIESIRDAARSGLISPEDAYKMERARRDNPPYVARERYIEGVREVTGKLLAGSGGEKGTGLYQEMMGIMNDFASVQGYVQVFLSGANEKARGFANAAIDYKLPRVGKSGREIVKGWRDRQARRLRRFRAWYRT